MIAPMSPRSSTVRRTSAISRGKTETESSVAWGTPAGAPTVLIYGHLDLQPVKGEVWRTDPHVATRVGDRLYARGAADDMGGWVSHLAALQVGGPLG